MSNLIRSIAMDYKVTEFNDAALLPDSADHKSGYPLIDDPPNQDNAAYMKQVK